VKAVHSFKLSRPVSISVGAVHVRINGVTSDAAFPTPMDEPRKIMSCHFLGTLPVSMATGIVIVAFSCH